MPWNWDTDRASTLPRNWKRLRQRILARDPHCQLHYEGCTTISTEVDHIGHRLNHDPSNLRGVCHTCHAKRTRVQSQQAKAARPQRQRPTPPHPGLHAR